MSTGNTGTLRVSKTIGVLAEDASDVDVIKAVLEKYAPKNKFSVRKFVGNGCGKLRSKCQAWAENLVTAGCEHIFLFHDLDRNIEPELRKSLESKLSKSKFSNSLVVIPIEEMEAWLLSDENAIKTVFSLKTVPKRYKNCEEVKSPKEEIERVVWSLGRKRYLNTAHNERLAAATSLDNLKRCASFVPLDAYIRKFIFPPPPKRKR